MSPDIISNIGPFFYLIIILSVLIVTFTMFINFVRGMVVIVGGLMLGYYTFIATPTQRDNLDNYAEKIINFSSNSDYMENIRSFQNKIMAEAKSKLTK